jgi:hypothetical protein
MEWAFIATNDRGQSDAALVRRFRQAVAKRVRAAVFDGVVREHRDAVLGRTAERLWPDVDASLVAAHDAFMVAYLAMGDPAKLPHPERLRDWLLGIAAEGELASGLPARLDAVNWAARQANIAADVPDKPDMAGSAARRARLRAWLEQIVATLPEPRQQMYDLFVRRALDGRNAATELGTDIADARRLRRENREAVLRAFEVTAFAAAEADVDPLDGETPGCGQLRQILTDAQVRRDNLVLPPALRLTVTRHLGQCDTCRARRDDCMARWAPEILPIVAGAELNEQIILDLRTIPEPGPSGQGAGAGDRSLGSHAARRGTSHAGAGNTVLSRRAAMAGGAGLLVMLLLLGFVRPGFFLSSASSAPRGASSSSKLPGSGSRGRSGNPQIIGTFDRVSGRPVPSTSGGSATGLSQGSGGSVAPTSSSAEPSISSTTQPSSSSSSPSAHSTSPSPSAPAPSVTAAGPTPVPTTPSPSTPASPTPTTPPPSTPPPSSPAPSTPPPS